MQLTIQAHAEALDLGNQMIEDIEASEDSGSALDMPPTHQCRSENP